MNGTNRTQRTLAVFITVLMLTMGLAQAASVNTYSGGQSSVDISLDDPSTYTDSVSGSVSLPAGETVNAAAMVVSQIRSIMDIQNAMTHFQLVTGLSCGIHCTTVVSHNIPLQVISPKMNQPSLSFL